MICHRCPVVGKETWRKTVLERITICVLFVNIIKKNCAGKTNYGEKFLIMSGMSHQKCYGNIPQTTLGERFLKEHYKTVPLGILWEHLPIMLWECSPEKLYEIRFLLICVTSPMCLHTIKYEKPEGGTKNLMCHTMRVRNKASTT